jgi:pilus assembly protein Flp/PilA
MRKVKGLLASVCEDDDGAALVEYTVLLGILLVAVIITIVWVGGWVSGHWTNLQAVLTGQ